MYCCEIESARRVSSSRKGHENGKMGDFREGELHYSVELKGHLVYPAEIDAKSMSE